MIISMAHLYGVVMYYATSVFELWFNHILYSRPEPLYFSLYFMGLNSPWFFVPIVLIYSSLQNIWQAMEFARSSKQKFL